MDTKTEQIINSWDGTNQDVERKLNEINQYFGGYGVEVIRQPNDYFGPYFLDTCALYVNMGDTYASTIVYDVRERQFIETSWGDWYEDRLDKGELVYN